MDYISGERIIGKSFRISKKVTKSTRSGAAEGKGRQQISVIKKLIGVLLLVLAGIFGGVLAVMPSWAAYVTVFMYISVQLWIWLEVPKK